MSERAAVKNNWAGAGGRFAGGAVLLVVITLLAYLPVYNATFYADDDGLVVHNDRLRTLDGLGEIWSDRQGTDGLYYPLTFTTYWVEYQLWGLDPRGYHIDNVILHVLNALLVWIVLRRLGVPGAWFAGAVFALHPANVESVAWVTERRNTLSSLFYLMSLLAYLHYRPLGRARSPGDGASGPTRRPWLKYGLSITFFLAALLSKTATLTLPAAILLLVWWKRGRVSLRDFWPLLPFFVLGLGLSLLTINLERSFVQEGGPGWGTYSVVDRALIAGHAVWFYLGKLLFPVHLAFHYPRWPIDAHAWRQYLYLVVTVAMLAAAFAVRRRVGRGPVTALLFFIGTLVPVLGFMNYFYMRYSFVADRVLYVPGVGVIALVVGAAVTGMRRLGAGAARAVPVFALVLIVVLGVGVWQRSSVFETPETLYRDVLAKYPDSWIAHFSLGCVLAANNRPEEAISELETALRLEPNHPATLGYLGVVFSQVGRYDEALAMYQEALRQNPNDVVIRTNLGLTYVQMGEYDKGIEEYAKALQLNPGYKPALDNLTRVVLYRVDALFKAGQTSEARDFAAKARALAERCGAHGLAGQIDRLVQQHRTPQP
ncbi:MAG: tetratricopeptide repeat protein [bacterium]